MNLNDVKPGLRVDGIRRRNGTCTGEVSLRSHGPMTAQWRAEVAWDAGDTTWALVSILTMLEEVTA